MRRRLAHALYWTAALVVIYGAALTYMLRANKDKSDAV